MHHPRAYRCIPFEAEFYARRRGDALSRERTGNMRVQCCGFRVCESAKCEAAEGRLWGDDAVSRLLGNRAFYENALRGWKFVFDNVK